MTETHLKILVLSPFIIWALAVFGWLYIQRKKSKQRAEKQNAELESLMNEYRKKVGK